MPLNPESVLGIDYGLRRIGLAIAGLETRLPQTLTTIDTSREDPLKTLDGVIKEHNVTRLVVGYPLDQNGQTTEQTKRTDDFITRLEQRFELPVVTQAESLTSVQAEQELQGLGKPYTKADIDALAALYILGDWLSQ